MENLPQGSILPPDVENAIRHDKQPEVRQRRTVIRLLHPWHNLVEVMKMQAVTTLTVYLWTNRWCSGGLEGLIHKPTSGRLLKASDEYILILEETIVNEQNEL